MMAATPKVSKRIRNKYSRYFLGYSFIENKLRNPSNGSKFLSEAYGLTVGFQAVNTPISSMDWKKLSPVAGTKTLATIT